MSGAQKSIRRSRPATARLRSFLKSTDTPGSIVNVAFDATEANVDWDGSGTAGDGTDSQGWIPLGDYGGNSLIFTGSFDGNSHTISNIYSNNTDKQIPGVFPFVS